MYTYIIYIYVYIYIYMYMLYMSSVTLWSEEKTAFNISRTLTCKPRPESGRDCLICAVFDGDRDAGCKSDVPWAGGGWLCVRASSLLLHRNVQRFRGGLVFKAHRLVYHSTLGLRVIKKKKKQAVPGAAPPSKSLPWLRLMTASERRRNNWKSFKDFCLKRFHNLWELPGS